MHKWEDVKTRNKKAFQSKANCPLAIDVWAISERDLTGWGVPGEQV